MMYSDKFVVAIKVNGKVLRETKDLVTLPFGSEFSVLVKNLNSKRAKFTLHIDGQDVLDGTEIIVNGNSEVELKRFIRNGNMEEGNAFKFIERTTAIEDGPRGIKVDDGVIRVEFWFEQDAPVVTTTHVNHTVHHYNDYWWNRYPYYGTPIQYYTTYTGGPAYSYTSSGSVPNGSVFQGGAGSSTASSGVSTAGLGGTLRGMSSNINPGQASINSVNVSAFASNVSGVETSGAQQANAPVWSNTMDTIQSDVNDVGITVPGSKVDQKFTTVWGFTAEAISHVIILRMAGKVGKVEVAAPVTVKTKNVCTTCRHVNKHNAKFCVECGTSLTII